jgi:hypothetical protein
MFVSEVDVLIRQEQYKGLLQEAALERLIRGSVRDGSTEPAKVLRPTGSGRLYRKAANWLGTKMVNWGCALLRSDTTPACYSQPALQQ